MKKLFFLAALLAVARLASAQHTEFVGRAGLNLSHFAGSGTEGESFINGYQGGGGTAITGYTNNPYGSRAALGAGAGLRLLHESRQPLLLALDLDFDFRRTRTDITRLSYYDGQHSAEYTADGTTYYQSLHLGLFGGLGYRLRLPGLHLDLLAGPELAAVLGRHETGQGTFAGTRAWSTDVDRSGILPVDLSLRTDLTAWHHRWGLNASYAWGVANYQAGMLGGSVQYAYSRSLRLSVAYRLKG